MRKRIFTIILVIGLIISSGMFVYSPLSYYLSSQSTMRLIQQVDTSVDQISSKKQDKMWKDAIAYNLCPSADNYEYVLQINQEGLMGFIEIPCIGIYEPIYHYDGATSLSKGVGHMADSPLPIGMKGTHAILSGHTGLSTRKIFDELTSLEVGDLFYIHIMKHIHAYKVDQIRMARPEVIKSVPTDPEKCYITLVTCTPYGVNTHRLLVRGHRVAYHSKTKQHIATKKHHRSPKTELMVTCLVLVCMWLMFIIIYKAKTKGGST